MKVAEMEGALLDYWVARACGIQVGMWGGIPVLEGGVGMSGSNVTKWNPSADWAQGGPIIERERIGIEPDGKTWDACFNAYHSYDGMEANPPHAYALNAPTPLIAAMRAFVASKFGQEVPDAALL